MGVKLVTGQAHAYGPRDKTGETIQGIPVAGIRWLLDREAIRDCLTRYLHQCQTNWYGINIGRK